jgi:hypothetical protein
MGEENQHGRRRRWVHAVVTIIIGCRPPPPLLLGRPSPLLFLDAGHRCRRHWVQAITVVIVRCTPSSSSSSSGAGHRSRRCWASSSSATDVGEVSGETEVMAMQHSTDMSHMTRLQL